MTITTGVGKKFMEELPLAIHTFAEGNPSSDTIMVAFFGPNAVLAPTIDTYSTSGEVTGGGYPAGGFAVPLIIVGASGSSRGGGAQFQDPYINPVSDLAATIVGVPARGLMMYNATQGNRNIFTLDFGANIIPAQGILIEWGVSNVLSLEQALIPLVGNQT